MLLFHPWRRVSEPRASERRAFVCLRQPSYFLFAWPKRKVTKEKGHPACALSGRPARKVREPWPGFSTGHPALAKRSRHPCRLPLRGLSAPTHRFRGAPGRATRILRVLFRTAGSKAKSRAAQRAAAALPLSLLLLPSPLLLLPSSSSSAG